MSLTHSQRVAVAKAILPRSVYTDETAPITTGTWLGSQYLGAGKAYPILRHAQYTPPRSTLYVCPVCGGMWARVIVTGQRWTTLVRPCTQHGLGILGQFADAFEMPYDAQVHDIMAGLTPQQYQIHLLTNGV